MHAAGKASFGKPLLLLGWYSLFAPAVGLITAWTTLCYLLSACSMIRRHVCQALAIYKLDLWPGACFKIKFCMALIHLVPVTGQLRGSCRSDFRSSIKGVLHFQWSWILSFAYPELPMNSLIISD